jgi:hypothetical protein
LVFCTAGPHHPTVSLSMTASNTQSENTLEYENSDGKIKIVLEDAFIFHVKPLSTIFIKGEHRYF